MWLYPPSAVRDSFFGLAMRLYPAVGLRFGIGLAPVPATGVDFLVAFELHLPSTVSDLSFLGNTWAVPALGGRGHGFRVAFELYRPWARACGFWVTFSDAFWHMAVGFWFLGFYLAVPALCGVGLGLGLFGLLVYHRRVGFGYRA